MAVNPTNTSNYLSRSSDLPSLATVTICGWFRTPASLPSYSYGGALVDHSTNYGLYIVLYQDGTHPYSGAQEYSASGEQHCDFAAGTATNTWYFYAVVRSGNAVSGGLRCYRAGISESLLTAAISGSTPTATTPTRLSLGNDFWGDDGPSRVAALKIWSGVALTAAEIEAERWFYTPVRTTDLHLWSPFNDQDDSNFRDYSGNGRHWTETGTVAQSGIDGPPISWAPARRQRFWIPAASPPVRGGLILGGRTLAGLTLGGLLR